MLSVGRSFSLFAQRLLDHRRLKNGTDCNRPVHSPGAIRFSSLEKSVVTAIKSALRFSINLQAIMRPADGRLFYWQKAVSLFSGDAGNADPHRRLFPQSLDVGIEGQTPVDDQLGNRIGAEKIGGCCQDQRIGVDDPLKHRLKIAFLDAALLAEQAAVAPPAGADGEIRRPEQTKPVLLGHAAADLFDHELELPSLRGEAMIPSTFFMFEQSSGKDQRPNRALS